MKSFKQFLQEKASYKVYCDMDGVLVDFLGGVAKEIGIKKEPDQFQIDEFLASYRGSHKEFWSNLEWTDDGKKLWDTLKDLNTEILSACPNKCTFTPNVVKGKKLWCKKKLGISRGINITTRKGKLKFVGPKNILIDDYIKNVNEWKAKGGIGIHHRNARASLVELKNILLG
tara:strand:- start:95 stop:610 length:516 start_codon:yes stop_codon:yes gene_type:complete